MLHQLKAGPYSYRSDPAVPAFDDTTPIFIFDDVCVLCSSGVLWMIRRTPNGNQKFMSVKAPLARALYAHYGLDPDAFDTFLFLKDGVPYVRWRGWLETGKTMSPPWNWLGVIGGIVPRPVGDAIYDVIQRNRYQWFGKRKECLVPDASLLARFL